MQKIVYFLLVGLLVSFGAFGEDLKWTAHWIMHPTVQPQDHAMILFRKSFDLPAKPGHFVVHVSADNHYRLFVNGKYITRGPCPWRHFALVFRNARPGRISSGG